MLNPLSPMNHRARIRLIETPPTGDPASPPAGGAPADAPPAEKTLTQSEVNAIAAREKSQGKAAAEQAIAEQLGVSITEAAEIIKKAREADEKTKSEAQKDRDAAAKEKQDAEADRSAAKVEVHQARLERAFAKVGVDLSDDKEQAKNARLLRLVSVEVGSSYEDVLAEVTQIQKDFPALFGGTPVTPGAKAPGGDPKGQPPKPTGGEDKFEAGRKRAQAKIGQTGENPLTANLKK